MFEVLTKANSATITMHDNAGLAPTAQWIIGRDPKAIYWAILSYAKMHGVPPVRVGYSILFDDTER